MTGKIYLLQEDGSLQPMSERSYVTEDRLQVLLRDYPDLLAGDQMDEENPRRWLLLSREVGIPFEQDGREWMSLDHLFLDQDAIPTLVEVKRSSDTRVRREVVGQMLDYASNAVVYWSVERLRARFEVACEEQKEDANQLVADLLQSDPADKTSVDAFWEQALTNLRAGKIRLVFVADQIPPELGRIVEFLNAYMAPVEVLAVEVRQYVGEGIRTLVPQVVGQTSQAQGRKSGGRAKKRKWDEPSFFRELEERNDAVAVTIARAILDWARSNVTRIWWGEGMRSGSFVPTLNYNERDHQLCAVWTNGAVEIYFYWFQYKPPFDSEEKRRELLARLNAIPGVSLPDDAIARRPGIPLSTLADESALQQFLHVFDWVVQEIKAL
ncbi:MAG: hypothetical protein GY832_03405 [Chloroflexi bacterium]|nr:hypothetical protein [Chloroflexota bacterium]